MPGPQEKRSHSQDALPDLESVPLSEVFTENPVLDGVVRRLLARDDGNVIAAFQSNPPGPLNGDG